MLFLCMCYYNIYSFDMFTCLHNVPWLVEEKHGFCYTYFKQLLLMKAHFDSAVSMRLYVHISGNNI